MLTPIVPITPTPPIPMPKLFSILSWNVEHFKDDPARSG